MQASLSSQTASPVDYLLVFVTSFLLWLLLTASLDPQELVAGAVVALVVTTLTGNRAAIMNGLRLTPTAPLGLVKYLGAFSVALVRANIDLAARVLNPSLPIRPAVVEVSTRLESPLGRLLLANSITLTPGTLSVDYNGDRLLVHWVYCPPGQDLGSATREIAAGFENNLKEFLK
ncbi:MAG: Na+/H+ antiporter subunit E [Pseudomonadota bacterium]|nr:Na+/H+ antiporter subunit E [Pseudomonadota bacterium]